jgi:hypothetical protein
VRLVTRTRIVLAAASGAENQDSAPDMALARGTVVTRRKRFAADRLAGTERERPRPGRKATKREHWARTIVEVTLHTTPENATRWSQRSLAEHLGVSQPLVERV